MPSHPRSDEAAAGGEKPDAELDISGETCPMTFVRTRLALDRLGPGKTLLVHLKGAEPLRNVPATAESLGHRVLWLKIDASGVGHLLLRHGP